MRRGPGGLAALGVQRQRDDREIAPQLTHVSAQGAVGGSPPARGSHASRTNGASRRRPATIRGAGEQRRQIEDVQDRGGGNQGRD